jgi:hypothetical protein
MKANVTHINRKKVLLPVTLFLLLGTAGISQVLLVQFSSPVFLTLEALKKESSDAFYGSDYKMSEEAVNVRSSSYSAGLMSRNEVQLEADILVEEWMTEAFILSMESDIVVESWMVESFAELKCANLMAEYLMLEAMYTATKSVTPNQYRTVSHN